MPREERGGAYQNVHRQREELSWGKTAFEEAKKIGMTAQTHDCSKTKYSGINLALLPLATQPPRNKKERP